MHIPTIQSFLDYYTRIRYRTLRMVQLMPEDRLDWTYREDKFTLGDLARHIALIERDMYVRNLQGLTSQYSGCGPTFAPDKAAILELYADTAEQMRAALEQVGDPTLQEKCETPGGASITRWKWLRALLEHEIHHRGQLYMYLTILEVPTPPLFGLTSEEVIERSQP